jgi:nucleoside-diphosphate-sugar epimerase
MITLVTGFPGWLGTRLVQALLDGLPDVPALAPPDRTRQVRCLVQPGAEVSSLDDLTRRVEISSGDLSDPVALRQFCKGAEGATLFHCAGIVHPNNRVREHFVVNADGTCRLLQAAEAAGVRRAILVSSIATLGDNPCHNHVFDESSPYNPYRSYGRSKMLMEQAAHEFQARGKIETVIVRPPWFYGPNQPPRQTFFFQMIKSGMFPLPGDGENRRSMGYVDNTCQGLLLCESVPEANGQTYCIADRRPYSMNEIVATVERLLEMEFRIPVTHKRMRLPNFTGEMAMHADGLLQRLGIYQQKIHVFSEMNKTLACSIAKAERELGYDPKIELEEGMRRSIAWAIDNGYKI